MFSKMPEPEDHVIEQLNDELELGPTQIKIWFDNKRCHIQDQRDIEEREILLLKNERLHAENLRMYLELNKRICVNCNNVEQKQKILQDLQNENARLIEEVRMIFNMIGLDLELRLKCNDDPSGQIWSSDRDDVRSRNFSRLNWNY
ncbi:hypothetical protein FXO38_08708 [Capsicum annuum]|uniref:Homeobox domain-containing protein n=1 Tax=Capsicum annuum TaxID=4072 RepID=A0A2G2Z7M1_CAPAN|nr:hypothetical protein FXO38_08708 [Capsicum annuum]PHT77969.1 hypothetical protein T459_16021 [Capsicum annuum]